MEEFDMVEVIKHFESKSTELIMQMYENFGNKYF